MDINRLEDREKETFVRALVDLYQDRSFGILHNFLNEELKQIDKALRSVSGESAFAQLQGRAQILESLLELVETSPSLLQEICEP